MTDEGKAIARSQNGKMLHMSSHRMGSSSARFIGTCAAMRRHASMVNTVLKYSRRLIHTPPPVTLVTNSTDSTILARQHKMTCHVTAVPKMYAAMEDDGSFTSR